jgi:hypothetical protein
MPQESRPAVVQGDERPHPRRVYGGSSPLRRSMAIYGQQTGSLFLGTLLIAVLLVVDHCSGRLPVTRLVGGGALEGGSMV